MLRWFHALLPREERFFDLFARHSEMVAAGAKALRAMLEGGEAVPVHYKTVMDREHDADNITREVLMAIRRSFITPFDRGDVKDLITSMDNAIDQMQKTAKTIMLFDQRAFTPQQREMADAIVAAAALVQEAMPLLSSISSNAGRISSISEELSQIEGRTDELHDVGLQELYRANLPTNSMAFFVGVEIYDHLEKVVDRFDDVGNEMHGIMLENV
jgi:predicted phosphate transport protein (TIGR00153 family)